MNNFETNQFVSIICCGCSVSFQVTEALNELRKKDGGSFFCPNGHPQAYVDNQEIQFKKNKEELVLTKKKLSEAEARIGYLEEQIEAMDSKEGKGIFDFLIKKKI